MLFVSCDVILADQQLIFVLDPFPLAIQTFGIISMAESTAVVLYSIISVVHPVPAVAKTRENTVLPRNRILWITQQA